MDSYHLIHERVVPADRLFSLLVLMTTVFSAQTGSLPMSPLTQLWFCRSAIKELSTALTLDASSIECLYLRASCHHAIGEYKAAVRCPLV